MGIHIAFGSWSSDMHLSSDPSPRLIGRSRIMAGGGHVRELRPQAALYSAGAILSAVYTRCNTGSPAPIGLCPWLLGWAVLRVH